MTQSKKIRSNYIEYRQGYLEVKPRPNKGSVRIEAWNIHPDLDISELSLDDEQFPETEVIANTDIELNKESLKNLIQHLQSALNELES